MNKEHILFYLGRVLILETVYDKIQKEYLYEQKKTWRRIGELEVEYEREPLPENQNRYSVLSSFGLSIVFGVLASIAYIILRYMYIELFESGFIFSTNAGIRQKDVIIAVVIGIIGVLLSMVILYNMAFDEQCAYEKSFAYADEHNKRCEERENKNAKEARELKAWWANKEQKYKDELRKIDIVRQQFYSVDLIPMHFREKVYYISYIYFTYSTSPFTYKEVLQDAKIEESTNRLIEAYEAQMASILEAVRDEVAKVRRICNENHRRVATQNERIIEQQIKTASSMEELSRRQEELRNEQSFTNWLLGCNWFENMNR